MEKYSRTPIRLHVAARLGSAILLLSGCAAGQEAPGRPAFEAASIKPSDPNNGIPPQMLAMMRDNRIASFKTVPMNDPVTVSLRDTSLEALIAMA